VDGCTGDRPPASAVGPWDGDVDIDALMEARFFAPARAQLGTPRWDEEIAVGGEMSFGEAIDFALSSRSSY
jgi:hypothetical protein